MGGSSFLVTGGSGFIGTNLVQMLLDRGDVVRSFDIRPPQNPEHASVWEHSDLTDRAGLVAAVRRYDPTHVLHMGARTDLAGREVDDYACNVAGVENLITALAGCTSLSRVIFASSRMVCRIGYQPRSDTEYSPYTVYGRSKVEGERLVRARATALPWILIRPASIWGPWFGVPYRTFFLAAARGRYVHPRGRTIYKSFGYVGNTIRQLDRLLLAPEASAPLGQTLYVADHPPLEVMRWAQLIRDAINGRRVRSVPEPVLGAAARIGDCLQWMGWREPPLTSFRIANVVTEMIYDIAPLRAATGDPPLMDLQQGVDGTVEWLRKVGLL